MRRAFGRAAMEMASLSCDWPAMTQAACRDHPCRRQGHADELRPPQGAAPDRRAAAADAPARQRRRRSAPSARRRRRQGPRAGRGGARRPRRRDRRPGAEQHGTGHAVQQAKEALAGFDGDVLILYGDTPFVEAGDDARDARRGSHGDGGPGVVVLGFRAGRPGAYGRIIARRGRPHRARWSNIRTRPRRSARSTCATRG